MSIIRKYVVRECIGPFFLSLGVLTCVFLLGNLIQLTNLVINKGVSLSTIGKIFVLYVPVLLGYTLPIACLVSVILTFSRLSADNEILALRASGFHILKLLIPFIFIGIIMTLFCIILNERIIPYAYDKQHRTLKSLGAENPTALLEAGLFIHAFQNQILFIHKIEDNKLYNITIYQPQPNGPTRTIIAKKGEFTPVPGENKIKMKLMDGTSDEPRFDDPDNFYKLNFETFFMDLDISQNTSKIEKKPQGMTLKELKEEMNKLHEHMIDAVRLKTEYLRKITWSFSAFIFILLGFPIAVITHRREKSANILLAIICAVCYYLLSLGCEALSMKSILNPALAMWIPNTILGICAVYLNLKCAS